MIGTLAFNECCARIVVAAEKGEKSVNWAYGYAKAGRSMTDREMIRVQADYILGNITKWRGDEAKMVRECLKEFAK